jgi:hypothetical protein
MVPSWPERVDLEIDRSPLIHFAAFALSPAPERAKKQSALTVTRLRAPRAELCYNSRMNAQMDPKQYINRLEYALRAQMAKINELRSEIDRLVAWINGDRDALTCLQAVYNDPNASEGNRIRAAASALPFERPKLSVSVQVAGPAVLGQRLEQASMKTVNPPQVIEHVPAGD